MTDSILDSIKKVLGILPDYLVFDQDVIMHTNSAFSTLNQLGIGPELGFTIENKDPVWADFIGTDKRLSSVKTYVYLRVRLLFDPPQTSYLIQSMNEQLRELEWRLNVKHEDEHWVDPDPTPVPVPDPDA